MASGARPKPKAMRQRVEYVIHDIENCSIVLDLYIIALTVLSPKVYCNAF